MIEGEPEDEDGDARVLEARLDGDGNTIDQSGWSIVSVDSEELVGYHRPASNAIDGDPNTINDEQTILDSQVKFLKNNNLSTVRNEIYLIGKY